MARSDIAPIFPHRRAAALVAVVALAVAPAILAYTITITAWDDGQRVKRGSAGG